MFFYFFMNLFCRHESRVAGGMSGSAEEEKKHEISWLFCKSTTFSKTNEKFYLFFSFPRLFPVVLNLTFGLLIRKLRFHTIRRHIMTSSYTHIVCCNGVTRKLLTFVLEPVSGYAERHRYWFYFVIYYQNFCYPCLFELFCLLSLVRTFRRHTVIDPNTPFCLWNRSEYFVPIRNVESRRVQYTSWIVRIVRTGQGKARGKGYVPLWSSESFCLNKIERSSRILCIIYIYVRPYFDSARFAYVE